MNAAGAAANAASGAVWMDPNHQTHPKMRRVGGFGELLHERAIKHCRKHGTGGRLSFLEIASLMADLAPVLALPREDKRGTVKLEKATLRELVERMVANDLLEDVGEVGGDQLFDLHDFHERQWHQPNPDDLAERREARAKEKSAARAEAGRKGGLTKEANRRAKEAEEAAKAAEDVASKASKRASKASHDPSQPPSQASLAEASSGSPSSSSEENKTKNKTPPTSESREASQASHGASQARASQPSRASYEAPEEGGGIFDSLEESGEHESIPAESETRIATAAASEEVIAAESEEDFELVDANEDHDAAMADLEAHYKRIEEAPSLAEAIRLQWARDLQNEGWDWDHYPSNQSALRKLEGYVAPIRETQAGRNELASIWAQSFLCQNEAADKKANVEPASLARWVDRYPEFRNAPPRKVRRLKKPSVAKASPREIPPASAEDLETFADRPDLDPDIAKLIRNATPKPRREWYPSGDGQTRDGPRVQVR